MVGWNNIILTMLLENLFDVVGISELAHPVSCEPNLLDKGVHQLYIQ
jgi:hypothetical protein